MDGLGERQRSANRPPCREAHQTGRARLLEGYTVGNASNGSLKSFFSPRGFIMRSKEGIDHKKHQSNSMKLDELISNDFQGMIRLAGGCKDSIYDAGFVKDPETALRFLGQYFLWYNGLSKFFKEHGIILLDLLEQIPAEVRQKYGVYTTGVVPDNLSRYMLFGDSYLKIESDNDLLILASDTAVCSVESYGNAMNWLFLESNSVGKLVAHENSRNTVWTCGNSFCSCHSYGDHWPQGYAKNHGKLAIRHEQDGKEEVALILGEKCSNFDDLTLTGQYQYGETIVARGMVVTNSAFSNGPRRPREPGEPPARH
jgi:hypothetical protein